MRVLITGVTGFAGGHLAEALDRPGLELFGVNRSGTWPVNLAALASRVRLFGCDLGDVERTRCVLRDVRPDQIYHLAGYASAGDSFRDADAAWEGNVTATRRLYQAVGRWGGRPRILYVGSGLVYEQADSLDHAHNEDCPLRPVSPYAASKAAADLLSYQCQRADGLDIVRARPFNHAGPRQSPQFAVAHFAQQIARAERGAGDRVLETGDLSPLRDLTDVRDTVRAYAVLMEHGRSGEVYNVATGRAVAMQEVVDRLAALARVPVTTRRRAELNRPADVPVVRGSAERLRRETGWVPGYSLERTLADTLDFWRTQP